MTGATLRQQRILEFITKEIVEKGRPPTVREIGDRFFITSPNGVVCHLRALETKGFITRTPGESRNITLAAGIASGDACQHCGHPNEADTELLNAARNIFAIDQETDINRLERAVAAFETPENGGEQT